MRRKTQLGIVTKMKLLRIIKDDYRNFFIPETQPFKKIHLEVICKRLWISQTRKVEYIRRLKNFLFSNKTKLQRLLLESVRIHRPIRNEEIGAVSLETNNNFAPVDGSPYHILSLDCAMVRIGSYNYIPHENITISRDGLRFSAPLIEDERITVPLHVQFEKIGCVFAYFGDEIPVLFFFINSTTENELRNSLGMQEPKGPWFDGLGRDRTQEYFAILPKKISEESAMTLKALFQPENRLRTMSIGSACGMLRYSTPKSDRKWIMNVIKRFRVEIPTVEDELTRYYHPTHL